MKNAGATLVDDWTIEVHMPFEVVNIWNAEIVSHVGDTYVIRNAAWNDKIAVGQSVSFGFQATPGNPSLSAFDWHL